ncbi:MAG: gamma-glutamyl-gamma-aminobutyrate hydrolase family protein [Ruminococcaceae bacterium]|jgi:putative glutamine amidotransferase|nr:gamma-glutamyl-gamma-aminobutyrate hydrolase family protein [Oscillospiraceae bacterium]
MVLGKPIICISNTSDALATFGDGAGADNVQSLGQRKIVSPSAYPRAIELAGGVPFLTTENCVEELAELCDGLLLSGGEDINPKWLGEEKLNDSVRYDDIRDEYEMALFKAFYAKKKPIFGICRGFQFINVAMGGGLYQDLVEQCGFVHMNREIRHPLRTKEGSLLYRLFGENFRVNSTHHQAVRGLAEGLIETAWSVEGIVEGFEHESLPIFGTQFHPERLTNIMWDDRTPDFAPLFKYFIDLCREYAEK